MIPCPSCHRHLRETERTCVFCGADVHASKVDADACLRGLGAIAFATMTLLGASACAPGDPGGQTATQGTTTDETSESGMTETATDSDDDPTGATQTSGSFYAGPDIDFGSPSECDPFAQDCPDGEKCVPYASTGGNWDKTKCVPVTGDGQPGDPCIYPSSVESTDDCDASSFCWNVVDVEGEKIGTCTEFCTGTADAPICPAGSSCLIANDASITLCAADCDPLAQDCPDGLGCYWSKKPKAFMCVGSGELVPGAPCGFINDCAPGSACIPAELLPECNNNCCAPFCSLAMPTCTTPGTECAAFFEDPPPAGYEDVGVCLVPPP